jgi:hypothetical protein
MLAADNILGLAFAIIADPSQANAAMDEFAAKTQATMAKVQSSSAQVNTTAEAMGRTIAQSLQMQGVSAQEAAQVYKQLGITGAQAGAEISAAFGESALSVGRSVEETKHSVRSLFPIMSETRQLARTMMAGFMAVMVIEHFAQLTESIRDAALALGGFGEEARKAFEDVAEASQDAQIHFQGLTTAAKIANAEFQIMQTNQRLAAIENEKASGAAASSLKVWAERLGLLGPATAFATQGQRSLTEAENEAGKLRTLLAAQLKELANLEEKRQKEEEAAARKADAAARKAEAAQHAEERRLDRLNAAILRWQNQQIDAMERVAREWGRLRDQEERYASQMETSFKVFVGREEQRIRAELDEKQHRDWVRQKADVEAAQKAIKEHYQQLGMLGILGGRVYAELARDANLYAAAGVSAHQLVAGAIIAESIAMGLAAVAGDQAFKMMLRQLGEYIQKKATIKAAEQVAEALSSWPNFVAMAHHFAAAAAWEVLGGAASAAVSAIGYGTSMGRSAASVAAGAGTAAAPTVAPSTSGLLAPGARRQERAQGVTVIFQGPIYGGQAGLRQLVHHISDVVERHNVRLVSSQAKSPVTASH